MGEKGSSTVHEKRREVRKEVVDSRVKKEVVLCIERPDG